MICFRPTLILTWGVVSIYLGCYVYISEKVMGILIIFTQVIYIYSHEYKHLIWLSLVCHCFLFIFIFLFGFVSEGWSKKSNSPPVCYWCVQHIKNHWGCRPSFCGFRVSQQNDKKTSLNYRERHFISSVKWFDDSFPNSDHYLSTVTWVSDTRIAVQWQKRDQSHVLLQVYDLTGNNWVAGTVSDQLLHTRQ